MLFAGKIDQIAFAARTDEEEQAIKVALGLDKAEWIEDHCIASGEVFGEKGTNEAKLLFNYDMGIEVEILRYVSGPNYLDGHPPLLGRTRSSYGYVESTRQCHIGIHHDGVGPVPTFDYPIAQRVETQAHTNPYLLEKGRKYRYTIYDSFQALGVYLKVIERIETDA